MLQHLGHAELRMLRVSYLRPQAATALAQPGVEFGKGAKALLGRIDPDTPPAVLHVLLDDTLLPAAGHVAEVGVEQVVRTHHRKAGVDHSALALLDLVHGRLHVVVDAPTGHPAQRRKAARVRIEQHLVPLAGIRHQPERTAGTQLHVRDLQPVVNAAHHQAFFAPVKLECLAQLERQGHEGSRRCRLALALAPLADEVRHTAVAAFVTCRLELAVQRPRRSALVLRPMGINLERLLENLVEGRQFARLLTSPVLGLTIQWCLKPLGYRVARQPRHPRDLPL